jgi:hypothetical protein
MAGRPEHKASIAGAEGVGLAGPLAAAARFRRPSQAQDTATGASQ